MSKNDELNWSTDLRRIAWWLQTGNTKLAYSFIERGEKIYTTGKTVGKRDWKWWFDQIKDTDRIKAAERALTWSVLLR